ncbi:hypothetical protein LCGC14_1132730 [marine sediment metagenome]|uniref:Uncharacterized protein n=1 Tax=marine sediment metagenome TaxID=412755 RepID=A0A0F9Q6E7_9ZZZZ
MVTPRGNLMELIDNISDKKIMAERLGYMTQTDELHNTILRWLDEVDSETDLSKMAAMIIAEVKNG